MSTRTENEGLGVAPAKPVAGPSAISLPSVGDAAPVPNALTHAALVELAYGWVLRRTPCGFAFKELVSLAGEIPDVIGFGSRDYSVIVECKVSRADFFADRKKRFRIPGALSCGRFRFYACPDGMVKVDEVPQGWGLLYAKGTRIRAVHNPYLPTGSNVWRNGLDEVNEHAERCLMYSALRRLHLRGRIEEIYSDPRVSDRSGTPQPVSGEEYSGERGPKGDAQNQTEDAAS